jgi:GNAT superfamily N-acetyltransferase
MKEQPNVASAQSRCAVRPPQPGDCGRMATLARQLGYECTGKEVLERLGEMQDSNQYVVYVAELPGGQIAGWIGAYVFRSVAIASCAEINGLVVDQGARSRGIGKMLIDAAEEWARRVGCHAISVRSNVKRDRAHQFYTNNGYEHVKTQKEFRKSL